MHARTALQQLTDALAFVEQSVYDGEVEGIDMLVDACQNFKTAGQNFDVPDGPFPGVGALEPGLAGISREGLEQLNAQLCRVISAMEMAQESVQDELGAIHRGRRGLRGYQNLQAITTCQYVSASH